MKIQLSVLNNSVILLMEYWYISDFLEKKLIPILSIIDKEYKRFAKKCQKKNKAKMADRAL